MGFNIPPPSITTAEFVGTDCQFYSKAVLGVSCLALFIIGSIAAAGACSSAVAGGLTVGVAGLSGLSLTSFICRGDQYNSPAYKVRVLSMILLVSSLMIIGGLGCGGALSAAQVGGCILGFGFTAAFVSCCVTSSEARRDGRN